MTDEKAQQKIEEIAKQTGLPTTDPIRFSAEPLTEVVAWGNIESAWQHSALNQLASRLDPKYTFAVVRRAQHGGRAQTALVVRISRCDKARRPKEQMHPNGLGCG